MPTRKTITGDWLTNGLRDGQAGRNWRIVLADGQAYDATDFDADPIGTPPIRLAEGELAPEGATPGWGFLPDEGEIDRVGRKAFHAKAGTELGQ